MTTNIVIELPDDPEEAVRRLREELRAARRRREVARRTAAFVTYRRLPFAGLDPVPQRDGGLREGRSGL